MLPLSNSAKKHPGLIAQPETRYGRFTVQSTRPVRIPAGKRARDMQLPWILIDKKHSNGTALHGPVVLVGPVALALARAVRFGIGQDDLARNLAREPVEVRQFPLSHVDHFSLEMCTGTIGHCKGWELPLQGLDHPELAGSPFPSHHRKFLESNVLESIRTEAFGQEFGCLPLLLRAREAMAKVVTEVDEIAPGFIRRPNLTQHNAIKFSQTLSLHRPSLQVSPPTCFPSADAA